jgi:uncharacterized coiled-coil protein SlyX
MYTKQINESMADLALELAKIPPIESALQSARNSLRAWSDKLGDPNDTKPQNTASQVSTWQARVNELEIQLAEQKKVVADLENEINYAQDQRDAFKSRFELSIMEGDSAEEAAIKAEEEAARVTPPPSMGFQWKWYHFAGIGVVVVILGIILWKKFKK